MNYCLIDGSDVKDKLECEGHVLKPFFESSKLFDTKQNLELIRKTSRVEEHLKRRSHNYFNIVHLSGHGLYTKQNKTYLDYTAIVQRLNGVDTEIFRPDTIVRTGLMADVVVSMNCQTFNPLFIDIIRNHQGVSNFIAPINSPKIGNTLVFSMMFYNLLLRKTSKVANKFQDKHILDAFKLAKLAYRKYNNKEDYRLYNSRLDKVYK